MALQNANRTSNLFIPTYATPATTHPLFRSTAQNNNHLPTLHIQQPSVQASFDSPFQTPFRGRHRPNASIAQFGIISPPSFQQGYFQPPHSPFHHPPGATSFVKSRRTASISLGGPPKALLGGPQRKPSPLSGLGQEVTDQRSPADSEQQPTRPIKKKVLVNLPEESAPTIYEGKAYQLAPWARHPWPSQPYLSQVTDDHLLDISTGRIYPTEEMKLEHFKVSLPSQVFSYVLYFP
jgi:hypothetical protein